jgi:hypothetical protein
VSQPPIDPTPTPGPPPAQTPAPPQRLAGVRPLQHDDDERPSREDRGFGHNPFEIPVPVPKWLKSRKERRGER